VEELDEAMSEAIAVKRPALVEIASDMELIEADLRKPNTARRVAETKERASRDRYRLFQRLTRRTEFKPLI